jgi:hypothetical protein
MLWLLACADMIKEDSSNAPPINQDDSGEAACTGTPPVLEEVVIQDGGQIQAEDGTMYDSLLIAGRATDVDRDLHIVDLDIWYDDLVDGSVDTGGAALSADAYRMIDLEPCEAPSAQYGYKLPVDGNTLSSGVSYEFALIFYDSIGLASEMKIGSGTAP